MNFIIEHQYLLAGIGTCLIVVACCIYYMMRNQPQDPTKVSYVKPTEEEEEEVKKETAVFTFIDGTTKKYTAENISLEDGYFEVSDHFELIAWIPFNQVKHMDYE